MLTPPRLNYDLYHFYPFGNTPPVDLLKDCSTAESGPTRLLLLGCGDVRNVLRNAFEFTLCDNNAAILARNVFLFTYLIAIHKDINGGGQATEQKLSVLWQQYYHLYITDSCLSMIREHATDLLRHSVTTESWLQSPYGSTITFTGGSVPAAIRSHWAFYSADMNFRLDGKFGRLYKQNIKELHRSAGEVGYKCGIQGAGIHTNDSSGTAAQVRDRYWESGVPAGQEEIGLGAGGGNANPTFSDVRAEKFACTLQRLSSFAAAYHTVTAFAGLSNHDQETQSRKVTEVCRDQFDSWCKAFIHSAMESEVTILAHHGEALRFSHAISRIQNGQPVIPEELFAYEQSLSSGELAFSQAACERLSFKFYAIDTSNLTDHVGLLAILPGVVPMLEPSHLSVLMTESLMVNLDAPDSSLKEMLGVDIQLAATLFGVVPLGYATGFSTAWDFPNAAASGDDYTNTARFTWRLTTTTALPDQTLVVPIAKFRPSNLAQLLLHWYNIMLNEDADLVAYQKSIEKRPPGILSHAMSRYTPASFAILMNFVRHMVDTDWAVAPSHFCHSLRRIIEHHDVGHKALELLTYLRLFGLIDSKEVIWTLPLECHMAQLLVPENRSDLSHINFALCVPRSALLVAGERFGLHSLTASSSVDITFSDGQDHRIQALYACFGTCARLDGQDILRVMEDQEGWFGQSNMIVIGTLPKIMLDQLNLQTTQIGIVLDQHWTKRGRGARVLGRALSTYYQTHLADREHVYFFGAPGTRSLEVDTRHVVPERRSQSATLEVEAGDRGSIGSARLVLKDSIVARTPALTSAVPTMKMHSPCHGFFSLGGQTYEVKFPCPIRDIEAEIIHKDGPKTLAFRFRLTSADRSTGIADCPFSVVQAGSQFHSESLPKILLSRLPKTDFDLENKHYYNGLLCTLGVSAILQQGRQALSPFLKTAVWIHELLGIYTRAKRGGNKHWPICVAFSMNQMPDMVLNIQSIRHDLGGGTVVMDGFFMVINHLNIEQFLPVMQCRTLKTDTMVIEDIKTYQALKCLFCAAAERCREGWTHGPQCEYKAPGAHIPLSLERHESPVCSCGMGKNLTDYPHELRTLKNSATRVALSCLFPAAEVDVKLFTKTNKYQQVHGQLLAGVAPQDVLLDGVKKEMCNACYSTDGQFKACSRCKKVKYCDAECQRKDWKTHKKVCVSVPKQ
ncbi:hypothetical protein KVT40_004200 [Elsinoe batatas]|uniref:MYND-type domain-containing protein n=1 Tax=Elsinoe batatas TaxID=2601811 RepID=A0A8K0L3A1_9PEZI|nr:hypothetical protein KVT40_004200 [Elsinoe batatas]